MLQQPELMDKTQMNRKQFLAASTKLCAGTCFCTMMGGAGTLNADDNTPGKETKVEAPRSQKRIEFAEKWVTRFMDVLDNNVDDATFNKIMEDNGRRCFHNRLEETGQKIPTMTLEEFTVWVKENDRDGMFRIEGNTVYFQVKKSARTGKYVRPGQCVCQFAESRPEGLSPRYCHCSIGYVREWFSQKISKPVEVELLTSVLRGDDWCKFKITV